MSRKAFTLLEILAVLTVLAILVGIAVPRIKGMQDQAARIKIQSELKAIQLVIEEAYINSDPHEYLPSSSTVAEDLAVSKASPQVLAGTSPYDPLAPVQAEYIYKRSSNGKYYVLASVGFDGTALTLDIADDGAVVKDVDDICVTNGKGC